MVVVVQEREGYIFGLGFIKKKQEAHCEDSHKALSLLSAIINDVI